MKRVIVERVLMQADYIARTGATVRACARKFAVSKTTVHKDMRLRLPLLDAKRAKAVDKVLNWNRRERHLRGGMATKRKYAK